MTSPITLPTCWWWMTTAASAKGAGKGAAGATTAGSTAKADDAAEVRETVEESARDIAAKAETSGGQVEVPWADYDEASVEQIRAVLLTADTDQAGRVAAYEQANKARPQVLEAAGRLAHAN